MLLCAAPIETFWNFWLSLKKQEQKKTEEEEELEIPAFIRKKMM